MTSKRALEIFEALIAQPAKPTTADIHRVCGPNHALQREVAEMLAADNALNPTQLDGTPNPFLNQRPTLQFSPDTDRSGTYMGDYELIERIGVGGMGAVYLACNRAAGLEQTVALKVLANAHAGNDSLARFEQERVLLAGLNHPNIAALYTAGSSDDGVPFFAMELVRGDPIDQYCEARGLSIEERLHLMLPVCDAIQAAHTQLIVHRDIKPSNVLINEAGQPKLLDFGIAKQLVDVDEERTVAGQAWLTPHYASPEQILGERVSVASDVYSMGVLLYKLLAGELPFAEAGASPAEVVATAEHGVARKVSDAAQDNNPPRWVNALKGDIDNILTKALESNPRLRYQSALELADDIRRFLEGFPVNARPHTTAYRLGKFFKRYRTPLLATASAGLALVAVALIALDQRNISRAEAARAERANEFLFDVLLSSGTSWMSTIEGNADLTISGLVNKLAPLIETRFADDPAQQVRFLVAIGRAQRENGDAATAATTIERAREVAFCCVDPFEPIQSSLLAERYELADVQGAEPIIQDAIDLADEILDDGHILKAAAYSDMGTNLYRQSRVAESVPFYNRAIALMRAGSSDKHARSMPIVLNNRAMVASQLGDIETATELMREVVEAWEMLPQAKTENYAISLKNLSEFQVFGGAFEEAVLNARRAHTSLLEIGGDGHRFLPLIVLNELVVLLRSGQVETLEAAIAEVAAGVIPASHSRRREFDLIRAQFAMVNGDLGFAEAVLATMVENNDERVSKYEIELEARVLSTRALLSHGLGDRREAMDFAGRSLAVLPGGTLESNPLFKLFEARRNCVTSGQSDCVSKGIVLNKEARVNVPTM